MTFNAVPVVASPWRGLTALVATLALAFTGCGTSDDAAGVRSDTGDPSTTTTAGAVTTEAPADPAAAADTTPESADNASWPPSALPVKAVHEFDNYVWRLVGTDAGVFAGFGSGAVRIGLDGTIDEVSVVGDELKWEPIYNSASETHLFLWGSSTTWSSLGFSATIDIDTLEVSTSRQPHGTFVAGWPDTSLNGATYGMGAGGSGWIDPHTFEVSEPLGLVAFGDGGGGVGDELWVWGNDGTGQVYEEDTGELIGDLDLGQPLGQFQSAIFDYDESTVWIRSSIDAAILAVDRTTLRTERTIDVGGLFPNAAATMPMATAGGYMLLELADGNGTWYVVAQVDLDTGDLLAAHTVATGPGDYWVSAIDQAEIVRSDGRLFVRDHYRRIVEVDLDAFGTETGSWEAPDLSPIPPIGDAEQVVADLAVRWFTGDFDGPVTNAELHETVTDFFDSIGVGGPDNDVDVLFVEISGDRAWVSARFNENLSPLLVFDFIDDHWALNTESTCWIASEFSRVNVCDLP